MHVEKLTVGRLLPMNCYIVTTDKATVVIDTGFYDDRVYEALSDTDKERMILLTHGHFDHIGAALRLRQETGVKIAIGALENASLSDPDINLSFKFKTKLQPFGADVLLNDGEEISVGDIVIKTVFTAGHTKGSVCYIIEGNLFSGDTVFFETCGRTDFPTGDFNDIRQSFDKLMNMLDDTTVIYAGHGDNSTVGHERRYNPLSKYRI